MYNESVLKETQKQWHGSLKRYITGFVGSVVFTLASFLLVMSKLLSGHYLIGALVILALVQATIQLLFFLHVGQEPRPRWGTVTFWSMLTVLVIVASGTLWVMNDLKERTMDNMQMENYVVPKGCGLPMKKALPGQMDD